MPKIKKEGVRDEDVRWWWNLNDIERCMMYKQDEIAIKVLLIDRLEKEEEDKAVKTVEKSLPIYGEPDDTSHKTGDDRPLPIELKNRINNYIQKRIGDNSEKYKNDIEQSSTFNALIRKEIKAGNL